MNDKISLQSDDAVEQLLGSATSRPVPPAAEASAVRAAVKSEWRIITGKRRTRRRFVSLGLAASVMLVAFLSLNLLRVNGVQELTVAAIGKSFGAIYVLGENAELMEGNHLTAVTAGQTLVTDDHSGIGLVWARGGSLRIDANTRVAFVADDEIYLRQGRVYFDSRPTMTTYGFGSSREPHLKIRTDHGEVRHIGTQFMAAATADSVTVSVRNGEVLVIADGQRENAVPGEQLTLSDGRRPVRLNVRGWGEAWQWVEDISPGVVLDDRTVDEFLRWVSHETGLQLRFSDAAAEAQANVEMMRGTVDTSPRQALKLFMQTTDLGWRIDDGVIYVGEK